MQDYTDFVPSDLHTNIDAAIVWTPDLYQTNDKMYRKSDLPKNTAETAKSWTSNKTVKTISVTQFNETMINVGMKDEMVIPPTQLTYNLTTLATSGKTLI